MRSSIAIRGRMSGGTSSPQCDLGWRNSRFGRGLKHYTRLKTFPFLMRLAQPLVVNFLHVEYQPSKCRDQTRSARLEVSSKMARDIVGIRWETVVESSKNDFHISQWKQKCRFQNFGILRDKLPWVDIDILRNITKCLTGDYFSRHFIKTVQPSTIECVGEKANQHVSSLKTVLGHTGDLPMSLKKLNMRYAMKFWESHQDFRSCIDYHWMNCVPLTSG